MGMRVREFAKTVDHTLLKPDIREKDVVQLCEEAAHYHFAAVCIPPCYVRLAARELRGVDVKVATVISFPFGNDTTAIKSAAVRDAITGGASELDVVMNVSKFLSGRLQLRSGRVIEPQPGDQRRCHEQRSERRGGEGHHRDGLPERQDEAFGDPDRRFQRRGFREDFDGIRSRSGATAADVAILREEAPEGIAVKAAGGIRTLEDALDILNAGASRLGMSASVEIMKEAEGGGLQE